ncbi:InlB B-repeat-containing protein, partial [Paratissierella segnis]
MKGKLSKHIAFLLVFAMILSANIVAYADVVGDGTQTAEVESPGDNPPSQEDDNTEGQEPTDPVEDDKDKPTNPEDEGTTEGEPVENKGEDPTEEPEDPEDGENTEEEPEIPEEELPIEEIPNLTSYIVRYMGETEPLLNDKTVEDQLIGSEITEFAKDIKGYEVDEDSKTITLQEEDNIIIFYYTPVKSLGPTELTARVDGVTIRISADEGVLPEGTELSVYSLPSGEARDYAETIRENTGVGLEDYLMFDITLLDGEGNEVQPDGNVTLSFTDVYFADDNKDIVVYHLEPNRRNVRTKSTFNLNGMSYDFAVNDMSAENENGEIIFTTNHFSIYAIGTQETATYEFYVGDDKIDTQIVKNGESLVEPSTPNAYEGKKFIGWYILGEENPIDFDTSITVNESNTFRVDARFADVYYVYFVYGGNVIATKEVEPNSTTNASDIPLIVTEEGKALSHWSAAENGEAFDFDTPITANTTLYAVLADRWKVTFDTQGGSSLLPKYIINGEKLGDIEVPVKAGYTFQKWNTQVDGKGTNYTSDTVIYGNVKLYAIWTPKNNTKYTVVYWQENADDDGYSYFESTIRIGTTGVSATYDNKNYSGFTLDTAKTNAEDVKISGDGAAIKNVYYSRNRYTLEFRRRSNNNELKSFGNIKQGADTTPWWNQAVNEYSTYTWYVSRTGNTAYSLAPDMPNKNLTVYGAESGNAKYTIFYLEYVAGNPSVREPYYFTGSSGLYLTIEDYISIPGFTVKSTPKDGSQNSKYNDDTKRYEWKLYYNRNKYNITFQTNDNTGNQNVSNIPYEADISDKALSGYVKDVTTRYDGYVFKGWYTNEATAGEPYNFTGKTMPANNLILHAKWVPPVYSVKYYLTPDTSGEYKTIDDISGGTTISEDKLEKDIPAGLEEEDFEGWYWYVNGVFVPYDFSTPINRNDIVLYPVWKNLVYEVTYNANGAGGTIPQDHNKYILGASATVLSPSDLTSPSDKVFIGWKEENSGKVYYPNDKLSITGNMTLIAQWGDKAPTTSLAYYGNGGFDGSDNASIEIPLKNNETHTVLSNSFIFEGHNFKEWNTKADRSGASYQPGAEIIVDNLNTTNELYAIWEKKADISYTVNYLEKDTEKVLATAKTVENKTFGEEVTETAIEIEGYNKVEPIEVAIELGVEENVINFYYTARTDISYTVNYLEEGTNEVLSPAK